MTGNQCRCVHTDVLSKECKISADIMIITDKKKWVQDVAALNFLSKFPSETYNVIKKNIFIKK